MSGSIAYESGWAAIDQTIPNWRRDNSFVGGSLDELVHEITTRA
jgi:hypothetical protein